jgi:peptidoglycan/xylan/chitin deacetylase (PgdA/CDA1 family)
MQKTVLVTVNVHGVGPEAVDTPEERLFGRFAHGRYTYRVGLARVLDGLRRADIRATFFWPAFEAQQCRELLDQCLADGHEVASHGNAFENHATLGEREAEVLTRAHEQLTAWTGTAPVGFRAPAYVLSRATLPILSGLGYRYDSSYIDDDAPYALDVDGGHGMVELPWHEAMSDATHFVRRFTQARAASAMRQEFDALIDADGYACLTLHPRSDIGVGRAARFGMVEDLFARMRAAGVSFALCREVAARCLVDGQVQWQGRPRP